MTRDADKFMLRMPDGMRSRLANRARANLRSMNSEVVMILASALGDEGQTATGPSPEKANPAAATDKAACQGSFITHG